MQNIVVLKLVSGEELVGVRTESGELERVRVFQMMQTQSGMQGALMPYFMSDPDATFKINASVIVAEIPASAQFERAYLEQTSSLDLSNKIQLQ